MILENHIPTTEISNLIKEFYFANIPADSEVKYKPIIDDGCYDFIFFKEKQTEFEYGIKKQIIPIEFETFTISLSNPPYKLKFDNSITFFTIKVQPWLNASFFPIQSQKGIIDLKTIYGNEIIELHKKLFKINSFEKQKELATSFIKNNTPILTPTIHFVKNICQEVYKKKGITSVQELAEKFEISRQEINKLFKDKVTYTLKKFIVIVRIVAVIKHKIKHPELAYTALSYEFGYFDQSHFNNDFKRICGVSPSKFFKELPPFLDRHK
ncbi:MAG: hypothetical protein COZ18_15090 [Flexibacter sp. CG_4_10_14_3_um_filter_32_15]|nr:MAG: hypothetical protein COZ18_15090 [Flexibacter sp. CG_4_10_14_3_um_filter_32_15]